MKGNQTPYKAASVVCGLGLKAAWMKDSASESRQHESFPLDGVSNTELRAGRLIWT